MLLMTMDVESDEKYYGLGMLNIRRKGEKNENPPILSLGVLKIRIIFSP